MNIVILYSKIRIYLQRERENIKKFYFHFFFHFFFNFYSFIFIQNIFNLISFIINITNNKLDETTARLIKEFIEKINEDNDYKTQQNQQIRILLYNNKELITNVINSLINKNE